MEAIKNYVQSKHSFFKEVFPKENQNQNEKELNETRDLRLIKAKADKKVDEKDYTFIARNVNFIEHDLNNIFKTLQKDNKNYKKYWLYCYYCSALLKKYYAAYEKKESEEKYEKECKKIKTYFEKKDENESELSQKNNDSYASTLRKILVADLSALITTPMHSVEIKNRAEVINMMRLQLVFSKLFIRQFVSGFEKTQLMARLLGGQAGINHAITMLDKTTGAFNLLSVGVFALHFAMEAGELLKHTFKNPENSKLTVKERFIHEFNDRHCTMINDLVWTTVNGLANYAKYFNISAPVANWSMSAFTVFDMALQLYKHQLAKQRYEQKKEGYQLEKKECSDNPDACRFIEAQEKRLDQDWELTEAKLHFNLTGAFILLSGLSASLLLSAPAVPIGFFMSTLAFGMFVSAEKYGAYKEKQFVLSNVLSEEQNRPDTKDISNAQSELLTSVAINTLVPISFMGLFAVSWPAALLLAVLIAGYDLHGRATASMEDEPSITPSR